MSTPQLTKYKHWCFTWNNYTEDDVKFLSTDPLPGNATYVTFGKEVGSKNGTPHLQGFISFKDRKRLTQVKKILLPGNPNLSSSRDPVASVKYCWKEADEVFKFGVCPFDLEKGNGKISGLDSFKQSVNDGEYDLVVLRELHSAVFARYYRFCTQYVNDRVPKKIYPIYPLREWQSDLENSLAQEPDDRTITFVVDYTGNAGKTWFAHQYKQKYPYSAILTPGKKSDMAYVLSQIPGIRTSRVIFLDAPRSKQGDIIQYDFLEDVKNGYVFVPKYESCYLELSKLHLVVMLNEDPDMTKLSEDRYILIHLNDRPSGNYPIFN